ncbi:MAG: phospholipid carrier-dependent glycosyltransferase [Abditibacteriota bacterium]|nr:phospholipid carrier-dependent glycosyltransferase [Abditibacteriota bacterium]
MNKKTLVFFIIFFIIIGISAYLNYSGIKWSLPNDSHYYSYHPDEGINIGGAIRIFGGAKEPGFYNYSSLYFYLVAYALSFSSSFGILNLGETLTADNLRTIYMCGRMTSVIFSVLTVALVMLTGYRLKRKKIGLAAGLFCALCPIFIMHSKFIAVDITCGFFVALTIFLSTYLIKTENINPFAKSERKTFLLPLILSFVAVGLAMGTKYNGLIVFLVPLCVLIFSLIKKQLSIKDFILLFIMGGAFTLITFLITTPGLFLNTGQFIKDFTYELNHMKIGHGDEFVNTGLGLIYTFKENMYWGMGLIFSIISVIALIYGFFTKNTLIKSVGIFIIIYYISASMGQVRFARYIIPLLPAFSLISAFMLVDIYQKNNKIYKTFAVIGILIILGQNGWSAFRTDMSMTVLDNRDTVYNTLISDYKKITIGLPTVPWFYSPPFIKETSVMRSQRYDFAKECKEFNLLCQEEEKDEWNSEFLIENMPEYVLISSIEEFHKKRVGNKNYEEYMKVINENYQPEQVWKGFNIGPTEPTNKYYLPSDMTYIQPDFTLYKLKKD